MIIFFFITLGAFIGMYFANLNKNDGNEYPDVPEDYYL